MNVLCVLTGHKWTPAEEANVMMCRRCGRLETFDPTVGARQNEEAGKPPSHHGGQA
jgi:hypothetical protein